MRYAFMTFSTPDLSLKEVLDLARRLGYDGIEPRAASGHRHGIELETTPEQRRAIRDQVEASGVSLCCLAVSCRYADPATRTENLEQTRRYLELAADIGSPRLRVFGGKIGESLSRSQAIQLVADALAELAPFAAEHGVTLCMETHDDWCHPRDVAAVMEAVDHPNVGVNWDVLHPVRRKFATLEESFQVLRPWIRHLHVHDVDPNTGKLTPIGTGMIDHRRLLELLASLDYDGYLSGEWIRWEVPYSEHLPQELATLRRYERELGI
ncbi:MAG: hypothetical protein KatS3mg115_1871 [Candidatus Poribacteria bacterium]|nr:MAG: hypothetical protein KatS3mg115_1871 [Candidatus Poribacteria bacterium]